MVEPPRRACEECREVGAEAVLREWLAVVRGRALPDAAALHAWARRDPAAFRAAFAAFAGIDAADPRLGAAAGWLLGAGVRPDDLVHWTGDPADPWLAGRFVTGATLIDEKGAATVVLGTAVPWPPSGPVRPPASGPDAR